MHAVFLDTFDFASGELWRSRFYCNLIVVNNGHRDFVFASLVLRNFSGMPGDQLLERMIELSLYTEDKL
jgi:hypothetical protein